MMISAVMKLKLLTLANKYGVEIVHFIPGNVVVHIASWDEYENKFHYFLEDLLNDPYIISIILDRGYVDIQYEPNALNDPDVINRWLAIFEKYSF